jgi:hypothetical protein
MAIKAQIRAGISATQTGPTDYPSQFTPNVERVMRLVNGTTAGQADILFADERTVASDTSDDLDLAGVLTNAFGATITAAELVALLIINAPKTGAANTTTLTIGGGSNPVVGFLGGTTPTIGPIQPGGVVLLAADHASGLGAITAATADILRITNSAGAAAKYQIVILARSA